MAVAGITGNPDDAGNLPEQWRAAYRRDLENPAQGNDPAPERKAARVLAAFILTGLVFVALPGTFLGVWNLLTIAEQHTGTGASTAWIQAHGQAQLFGWVGTFILGISLYVLPKFLGRFLTRFALVWTVWVLWTAGAAWRWWAGVGARHWRIALIASAILELAAFFLSQYLLWFDRGAAHTAGGKQPARKPFPGDLASWLGLAGFLGFGVSLLVNLGISIYVARNASLPVYPPIAGRIFLVIALWGFAIPVAWGYSSRFVTIFVGLPKPVVEATRWLAAAVTAVVVCALAGQFLIADLLAVVMTLGAVWALQVFRPSMREPKRNGVYRHFPFFIRAAYAWVIVGAALGVWSDLAPGLTGLGGASRHALTVGFLATLIFCVGPLILPAFLSGRQLRSPLLMGASLWLISLGCLLRVSSEAVAYSAGGLAWKVLPFSAILELTAVFLFVVNLGVTMMQRIPAWFGEGGVAREMPVYFYVTSFPGTKRLLIEAGLKTLARVKEIPRSLTLSEAAAADGADVEQLLVQLRAYFAQRQPRRRGAA
jgi:uncharacterized protein involved in response to NO